MSNLINFCLEPCLRILKNVYIYNNNKENVWLPFDCSWKNYWLNDTIGHNQYFFSFDVKVTKKRATRTSWHINLLIPRLVRACNAIVHIDVRRSDEVKIVQVLVRIRNFPNYNNMKRNCAYRWNCDRKGFVTHFNDWLISVVFLSRVMTSNLQKRGHKWARSQLS